MAAALTLGRMPPFVSTSAIVVEDDHILVVVDPIRREPVLPGGHLKWREAPEAAVVREVREETGLRVEVRGLVGVFSGLEWADEPGVVRIVYHAGVAGGTLTSSAEGEARWMPVEALVASDTRDAPIVGCWLEKFPRRPSGP
jgi:8-oxo-dGTP diphosphatase